MILRHPVVALAATAGWLLLTTGYGAAAAEPGVDLGGAPLPNGRGSADPTNPTVIEAGLWADTLGAGASDGEVHHFTYRRTMQDSTVHIGVIGAPTAAGSGTVTVDVLDPDEDSCASDYDSPDYAVPEAVFGASVVVGPDEPDDRESACLTAAELDFTITRSNGEEGDLPIAIKVLEEATPSAEGLEELPGEPRYDVGSPGGDAAEVAGAASFDDAPEVTPGDPGAVVTTTIPEGEERLWNVPVGWGQGLSAVAEVPAVDPSGLSEEDASELTYTAPGVDLRVIGPDRDSINVGRDDAVNTGDYGTDPLTLEVATVPVNYLNRFEGRRPTLPGDFWVAVAVEDLPPDAARDRVDVPVELTIAVTDGPDGAPTYPGTVLSPDGEAGPADYDPETPFLIGPDQFSAVASDVPVLPGAEDDGWWGPRRYAGIGLAVASLVCCGLGVRRLLLR
ncbi:hypothetical protein HNR19_004175 [Nocardioides thalensis]|uniref:Uncharacterized protein n=1 Tax=Nocardioides thalensis TaxID=1914755 RepID=A0A853C839_9ACTN|nr:hypothetical protein [Nocardioides thalensis]NYJ03477.1 hypothetical protein [Nocardioides thalensis]